MSNTTPEKIATEQSFFNNKTYDLAQAFVTMVFPAVLVLYAALASVWHWAYTEQVIASGAAIVTFLGVVLKVSQTRYKKAVQNTYDGFIAVDTSATDSATVRLSLDTPVDALQNRDAVVLRLSDLDELRRKAINQQPRDVGPLG